MWKQLKLIFNDILSVVLALLALFFILLVGAVVIVVCMLALYVWLAINSVQAVYKSFAKV